jgi:hypothetical protein
LAYNLQFYVLSPFHIPVLNPQSVEETVTARIKMDMNLLEPKED